METTIDRLVWIRYMLDDIQREARSMRLALVVEDEANRRGATCRLLEEIEITSGMRSRRVLDEINTLTTYQRAQRPPSDR